MHPRDRAPASAIGRGERTTLREVYEYLRWNCICAMMAPSVLTGCLVLGLAAGAPPTKKPHLVYVLSDNLCGQPASHPSHLAAQPAALTSGSWRLPRGWGNVGYHRTISAAGPSPEVVTPNIDALVACAAAPRPPHPTPSSHPIPEPAPTDPPPRRRRRAGPASSWTASTHISSARLRALHSSPAASRSTSTCTTKASAHPAAGSPSA